MEKRGYAVEKKKVNYYGSLCTEMYEILHGTAPSDELAFYLSYAEKGMKILEPLCGSGRFLVPFVNKGLDICGIDLSEEMLEKLREKIPEARVVQADILDYSPEETFDYIFISSGSVSLFTDMQLCRRILQKMKMLLAPGGRFVFAVDTVAERCPDDTDYHTSISVKTGAGLDLILKTKNHYDENSQTQFSPGIYELYDGSRLLKSETMDFQTHLYRWGEMEGYLQEAGFRAVAVYASYQKESARDDSSPMLLYECSL